MNGEFLPQYAAQAVIDLERLLKTPPAGFKFKSPGYSADRYLAYTRAVIGMLRAGVHVVLPANGEIYRSNDMDRAMPTEDECASFVGLPAPVTCFEYSWTHRAAMRDQAIGAPKRITIVGDSKQIFDVGNVPEGFSHSATFISIVFNEISRTWIPLDTTLAVLSPLVVSKGKINSANWGLRGKLTNELTGQEIRDVPAHIFGEWYADVISTVQCCHALRAGATLEERTESSSSRRWKFEKRGVGGFVYHLLTIPKGAAGRNSAGESGGHASPRLHVRRAHIRKLPTGALTFVRQCLVGDPEKGVVEKNYAVRRTVSAA